MFRYSAVNIISYHKEKSKVIHICAKKRQRQSAAVKIITDRSGIRLYLFKDLKIKNVKTKKETTILKIVVSFGGEEEI